MTIEQKLEKKINTIVQITGEYPEELEVTKQEQEQLRTDNFRGVKLIVKYKALMNREDLKNYRHTQERIRKYGKVNKETVGQFIYIKILIRRCLKWKTY